MQIKTSELTGAALNLAVNHAERLTGVLAPVNYCGKWEFGGPIIERHGICVAKVGRSLDDAMAPHEACWCAHIDGGFAAYGETPLVAAMRCYVASKLGDTVDIPEELV